MAPTDKVGEVAVLDLDEVLWNEMREQSLWETSIPAWHPRNEGDDAGEGDGDTGDPPGDDDDADTRTEAEKAAALAQEAVNKAHEKLRASEKEQARLAAQVKKHERSGMEENERLKQELEDARLESAGLQEQLDRTERKESILSLATAMKFRDPSKAARLVPVDATDEKSIKAALKDILTDFPELKAGGSAPPPINSGDNTNNNGSTNARMNAALRQAAGRS